MTMSHVLRIPTENFENVIRIFRILKEEQDLKIIRRSHFRLVLSFSQDSTDNIESRNDVKDIRVTSWSESKEERGWHQSFSKRTKERSCGKIPSIFSTSWRGICKKISQNCRWAQTKEKEKVELEFQSEIPWKLSKISALKRESDYLEVSNSLSWTKNPLWKKKNFEEK